MAKTLSQFKELYTPKAADEKKFVDKHVVKKHKDRNGNDDKLFNASNVKPVKRATDHGYETAGQHDDEKVYEETQVDEKMNLKTASMGDVVKDFQKSKAPQFAGKSKEKRQQMAVAAKLQAEEAEQVEEAEKVAKHRPGWMLRADKKLGDSAKQAKKMNQLMAKHGGKPEAGKTVKEEASQSEPTHAVTLTKGSVVGARSHKMFDVVADDEDHAVKVAKKQFKEKFPNEKHSQYHVSHVHAYKNYQNESVEQFEEASVDEGIGMAMSPNFKPWKASKGKKWKVTHSETGKVRGEWDEPVGALKHLKGLSPELQKVHKVVKEDQQVEEQKNIVDKSGAVHTPMSRARDLARRALKNEMEKHAKQAAAEVTKDKKKANEEIDYDNVKAYLLSVYENKSEEEKNLLNEMLETEEGTKLAFVVTYFSGE